jgi:hypothetical protein
MVETTRKEKRVKQAAEMNVSRNTSYHCGDVIQVVQLWLLIAESLA